MIGLDKLQRKYLPYEARRILCSSYEVFLVDSRILPMMGRLLGKVFFQKKKMPISINLKASNLQSEITRTVQSAQMRIPTGPCITVKVGNMEHQTTEQLVDNVFHSLPKIVDHIPRKWKNILTIQLKTNVSIALPIYQAKVSILMLTDQEAENDSTPIVKKSTMIPMNEESMWLDT